MLRRTGTRDKEFDLNFDQLRNIFSHIDLVDRWRVSLGIYLAHVRHPDFQSLRNYTLEPPQQTRFGHINFIK